VVGETGDCVGDEVNRFGNENREKLVRDGPSHKKKGP